MAASMIKSFPFSHSKPPNTHDAAPPRPSKLSSLSLSLPSSLARHWPTMPPKPSRDARSEQTTFRFLTRSHPDDFKDDEARQDVRSHVMRDYRRKNSPAPSRKPSRSRTKPRPSASDSSQRASSSSTAATGDPGITTTTDEPSSPTASSSLATSPVTSEFEWPLLDPYRVPPTCAHEERSRILLSSASAGAGPFPIATFIVPEWRRVVVCCGCLSKVAAQRLPPTGPGALSTARLAFLSSLFGECARRDLILNAKGKSQDVLNLEAEAITMVNTNLADPRTAVKDETVCGVMSLMTIEAMSGNDSVRRMHIRGLESIVVRLGGLANVIDRNELMVIASEQLLIHSALFDQGVPAILAESPDMLARERPWAEAPSYPCPLLLQRLERQAASDQPFLLKILSEMQELTLALLTPDTDMGPLGGVSAGERARGCWFELARNPCATPVNGRNAGDWLYEACRIAGLVYCTAIAEQLPIPAAASLAAARLKTPMLLEMLCSAIYQSDMTGLWGEMAGAYVWTVLIGGCAANGSVEARDTTPPLLRRWLIYPAMACLNFLSTKHVDVVTASLRTMARVQQNLLGPE